MRPPARALIVAACFVVSSAFIHAAVVSGTPLLEWSALVTLLLVPLILPLISLDAKAWLVFVGLSAAFVWLVHAGGGRSLLYLPSVVIPGSLAWYFGRTLKAGREPLISSVARAARPSTPDYLITYSRHLTQAWTLVFVAMCGWDLGLALFAPPLVWSFMANGANYLVIGAMVVFEYLFRRWRFPAYEHPRFAEYLRIVVSADPRRSRP